MRAPAKRLHRETGVEGSNPSPSASLFSEHVAPERAFLTAGWIKIFYLRLHAGEHIIYANILYLDNRLSDEPRRD